MLQWVDRLTRLDGGQVSLFKKILGTDSSAQIRKLQARAEAINALEPEVQALTDAQLRERTVRFRQEIAQGTSLDDILPQAFATVREAAVRVLGMRHFDVQLIGGIVLHEGRVAEMKTGEGKTLAATLPAYLNALSGKGVHLVTVNDYLAKRDSEWMGKVYRFLGLSVGLITHESDTDARREAYASDITYGTNNEYGFDYLRDNMVIRKEDMVQRGLHYAIVDEVDSILIDEARTPLIISGRSEKSTDLYTRTDRFVSRLKNETDYTLDEKRKTVVLTEEGVAKAEKYFGIENLMDMENTTINHHINQGLKAYAIMHRDRDYVVQDGQVIIVDEFTGRLMTGRRYSEGLHQAIEAKERVQVAHENKTLATITFQNYFRMYGKLAGMTGTAKTEEEEFRGIYNLDVVEIPTYKPMIREDLNDVVYTTEQGKFKAVVNEIVECFERKQPVLVGTVSVEKSEIVSGLLLERGIKHEVLNAKNHRKEAEIVAQAGKLGAVTISTNMAGRGTDILLGGNPEFLTRQEMRRLGYDEELIEEASGHAETDDEALTEARRLFSELMEKHRAVTDAEHARVVEAGGLHIIGTERHESRRIDNQLRGRSGRQGDPGSSRFYVSLEDDLMRLFGSERIKGLMEKLNPGDEYPIEANMLSKQIESAQKRVEARNFDIRKHVLEYDDVMNQQREVIYEQRRTVLRGEDVSESIMQMAEELVDGALEQYLDENVNVDDLDLDGLNTYLSRTFFAEGEKAFEKEEIGEYSREGLKAVIMPRLRERYDAVTKNITEAGGNMREIERVVLLNNVDRHWIDHIDAMDQLRQGIGLRAYAHRNPVVEYKVEGFDMFEEMVHGIREQTVSMLFHVSMQARTERQRVAQPTTLSHGESAQNGSPAPKKNVQKIGRNAPCSCGSGKKYKNCCGRGV
ncbi:MAG: preprotein translocase subunit SecA [Bacillota bacterium]